jgi:hypothetical protein
MILNSFSGVVVVLFKLLYYFVFMAVIQFSGLVSGIQGKLNGSVLSKGRNGQVIYNRPTQRKEPTAAQLNIRAGFSAASYYWNDFTTQQKLDWDQIAEDNPVSDRFGNPTVLSGFDYFKRMMQLAYPQGSDSGIIPDLSGDPVYEHTPISAQANFSITNQGFQIDSFEVIFETINDSPAPNLVNLYISLPVRDNTRPYFKTWYLVKQFEVAASLGASEQVILDGTDILMPSGWRAFDGSPQLFKTVAFIPSQGGVSVEQIYPFIMSGQAPFEFPVFDLMPGFPGAYYRWNAGIDSRFIITWFVVSGELEASDFDLNVQWSPAQPSLSPPTVFGDVIVAGLLVLSPGPPIIFSLPNPTPPAFWKPAYDAEFPASADAPDGYFIPVRARLYHYPTSSYSAWVQGYAPVIDGP